MTTQKNKYISWGPQGSNKCILRLDEQGMQDLLKDLETFEADEEEIFEFKILSLTDEECENLPEFNGF